MTRIRKIAAILAVSFLAFSPTTHAADFIEHTDGAQMAFGYSFSFDACGDTEMGENYRKAIRDKVEQCPYTDTAKQQFRDFVADNEQKAKDKLEEYVKENGELPKKLNGAKMTCAQQEKDPGYVKRRKLFARYARGEISLDKVIPGSCESDSLTK